MPTRIQMYSEWGDYPFLVDEGTGLFWHADPSIFQVMFDVPAAVMQEVERWDKIFQDVLDWDDPGGSDWASPEDRNAYVERGREVMKQLRRHIPPDISIEYCADGSLTPEYY